MNMKSVLKKILPEFLIAYLRKMRAFYWLGRLYLSDMIRFAKWAMPEQGKATLEQLRARLTFHYHPIEKGLSHHNMRLGFGQKWLDLLHKTMVEYDNRNFDKNDLRFQTAVSVVKEYIRVHQSRGFDVSHVEQKFSRFLDDECEKTGGVNEHACDPSMDRRKLGFAELANLRVSVRQFSDKPVDDTLIVEAINISMRTPSACNRQPWRVHVIKNKNKQKEVLQYQGGFRGFDDTLDTLLAITVDQQCMVHLNERNEAFIDGGMFAMSLLYALEYVGLATCSLNAALSLEREKNIRRILKLPDQETIIMFIAVGHFPDKFKVPKSTRDPYQKIVRFIH